MSQGAAPDVEQIRSIVLKRVADDALSLPALPWALRACADALSESPFLPESLARAMEPDPLMVARLIRRANSAPYSDGTAVFTARDAAARLGARIVRIFLDDAGTDRFILSRTAQINEARQRVWEHCVAVALVARDLTSFALGWGNDVVQAAYTGGLIHDLGKPIVAALLLDSEKTLLNSGMDRWLDAADWVHLVTGCHATVGRLLAVKWGLPTSLRHCIAEPYAYDPWKPYAISNFVTLANAIVEHAGLDVDAPQDPVAMQLALHEGPKLLGFPEANIAWAGRDLQSRVSAHIGSWNLASAVQA